MSTYLRSKFTGEVFCTNFAENHPGAERLSAKEGKAAVKAQAIGRLHAMLKPGDTVYTILRHVSASGMSRRISVVIIDEGKPRDITAWVADVLDEKLGRDPGIVMSGGGMDMGFHLVYSLGSAMWPDGTPTPHGQRNGQPDADGGYALRHAWL